MKKIDDIMEKFDFGRYECDRLQRWIGDNMSDWLTICGVERKINKEEYHRLERLLCNDEFDYLCLVLFTIHGYALNEEHGDFRMVLLDLLIQACKNKGIELSPYPSFDEISEKLNVSQEAKDKALKNYNALAPKDENKEN